MLESVAAIDCDSWIECRGCADACSPAAILKIRNESGGNFSVVVPVSLGASVNRKPCSRPHLARDTHCVVWNGTECTPQSPETEVRTVASRAGGYGKATMEISARDIGASPVAFSDV